jgi:hypothetical protein
VIMTDRRSTTLDDSSFARGGNRMTTGLDGGPSLLVRSLKEDLRTERPGCAVRITRCWVPLGTRPDDQPRRSQLLSDLSIRSRSDDRCSGWVAMLRITQHGGNLSGNPGVTTRRYRTGLDESVRLLSSQDGSGRVQLKDFGPTRNRKVVGSNPTSGSISAGEWPSSKSSMFSWIRSWQPQCLD